MNLKVIRTYSPDWRTFLSGLFLVFSFPPWGFSFLVWICLIPWFWALKRAKDSRAAVTQGFWLSFFMSVGICHWVAYALQEYGNLPWIAGVLGLLLYAIIGQPQFPIFAWVLKRAQERAPNPPFFLLILLTLAYTGVDWILPKLFVDTLGNALYQAENLRQLADLGGPPLLTALIFLVNLTFGLTLSRILESTLNRRDKTPLLVLILFSIAWVYGNQRRASVEKLLGENQHGLQVAAIQGNIGDFDKIAAERGVYGAASRVLDTFIELSDQALSMTPRPEILIWPETSYPSSFKNPRTSFEANLDQRLEEFVKTRNVPLFFGGYDHFQQKDYNAFFLLTPEDRLSIYRKNILLFLGEYIPGADTFPILKETFPQVGNFGRGAGPEVIELSQKNPVRMAPIICYEALYTRYLLESSRKGSDLIVNITNDSWFGTWGEPQLHLALSTFRSIETRLPMIRTTNTGISALILPDEQIVSQTEIGQPRILNTRVPLIPEVPTLLKKWGDWFGPFALFFGFAGLGVFGLFNPIHHFVKSIRHVLKVILRS